MPTKFAVAQYCRDVWARKPGATNCKLEAISARIVDIRSVPNSFSGLVTEVPIVDPPVQTFDPGAADAEVTYNQILKTSILHSWFVDDVIVDPVPPSPPLAIDEGVPPIDINLANPNTNLAAQQLTPYQQSVNVQYHQPAGKTLRITAYSDQIPVPRVNFDIVVTMIAGGVALIYFGDTVERKTFYLGETVRYAQQIGLGVPPRAKVLADDKVEMTCSGYYAGAFFRGFSVKPVLS
jgi:hypothetical protein